VIVRPHATTGPRLMVVAAIAENGVIGRDNGLPWRLKSDLQHFRALTMGKPLVMGRKTYLSIGRVLPGRTSIVVSRSPDFAAPGAVVAPTLENALATARADAVRRGVDTIAVIGGAEIYAQTLPIADQLAVTLVHARPAGDIHFPAIDPQQWCEVDRVEMPAARGDEAAFAFISFQRV
jgi:dihydrofolate reductase